MIQPHFLKSILIAVFTLLAVGCAAGGDTRKPIPKAFFAAPQPSHRVVVVLPGRGDDLGSLDSKGVARIIQTAWPDADVILTGLTMPFYRQGNAISRLHDEIIIPTQAIGERETWLVGISLGGMGAVLYERDFPDQVDGVILLSPYLGNDSIHEKVRSAGGLLNWLPGPSQPVGPDTLDQEIWRTLKSVSLKPERVRDFWLAYGESEPFREPIELMSPILPDENVLMLPGRHNWKLWTTATKEVLERVKSKRGK